MDLIIGFAIFLCLLLWVYVKRIKYDNRSEEWSRHSAPQQADIKPTKKHLGVVLKSKKPESCCQAAKNMSDHLIEDNALPSLPLPNCDQPDCTCFFQKRFDERKGQERRTIEDRREHIRFEDKKDRRSKGDRRKQEGTVWKDDRY